MIPMAQVPLYADGVRKSDLRIGIEGRLHFLGVIYRDPMQGLANADEVIE
jgi:hypothetical protein